MRTLVIWKEQKKAHLRYRFLMEMMNVFLIMERLLLVILCSLSQQER